MELDGFESFIVEGVFNLTATTPVASTFFNAQSLYLDDEMYYAV